MPEGNAELPELSEKREVKGKPEISFWPYSDRPEWEFRYVGVHFDIKPSLFEHKARTKSSEEIYIPRGTMVGKGDFLPFKIDEYAPGTRRQAVLKGVEGLGKFIESIGQIDENHPDKPLPEPKFLIGITNERMANFLQRVGFSKVRPMGNIGFATGERTLEDHQFEVIGRMEEVKTAYSEIKDRLQSLDTRDSETSSPS